MPKPQTKRSAGRPKAEIDWNNVGRLLEAGASGVGIAATLGIDEGTLRKRCDSDNNCSFSEFAQQKKAKGDELLRTAQFKTAMSGNVVMQIWLGKQRLGQSDKREVTNINADLAQYIKVLKDWGIDKTPDELRAKAEQIEAANQIPAGMLVEKVIQVEGVQ